VVQLALLGHLSVVSGRTEDGCRFEPMVRADDAAQLQASFTSVVRALGLLRPDTTPCGQRMSVTEAHAIAELHDAGSMTQQSLAGGLRLQKSTVSRLVDELCADGLARRRRNPADGRSVLIELTALGTRRAERLAAARRALFDRLLERLTNEERRIVVAGLDRLAAAAHGD
jgi:DNA-binding MarR family transcriptional regulator